MTAFKQMLQWPPTLSSLIGLGLMAAGIDYMLTGSLSQAIFVAGLVKFALPQDAAAGDALTGLLQALQKEIGAPAQPAPAAPPPQPPNVTGANP